MNKKSIILITSSILIVLILCTSCFCLGRYCRFKHLSTSQSKLEQSLKTSLEKLKLIQERNELLENLINNSVETINYLEYENKTLNNKLNEINSICDDISNMLNDTSSSTNDIIEKIAKLQENQKIINDYIINIKSVVEE